MQFFYPVAVGGPITKIIDGFAADFMQTNPQIKVTPIYAGSYQESIVKALTAHKSGTPPVTQGPRQLGRTERCCCQADAKRRFRQRQHLGRADFVQRLPVLAVPDPDNAMEPDTLLRQADIAVDAADDSGKDCDRLSMSAWAT